MGALSIKFSKVVWFLRASLFSLPDAILLIEINPLVNPCVRGLSVAWGIGDYFLNSFKQGFLARQRAVYYALKQADISGLY